MALQLPHEVRGIAAGVLVYSFAGLMCSLLFVWLTWTHRGENKPLYIWLDVALIGYLLLASTATAVVTQLHTFVSWEDVATAQWEEAVAHPKSPEQIISNGAVGIDLGLWYFRTFLFSPSAYAFLLTICAGQYAFSASAMLVLFWAFALLQSIHGWTEKPQIKVTLNRINAAGKGTSIVLPIITICLLQVKSVQKSVVAFMFLANVVLMISLAGGCGFMLAILLRYIQSRRQLLGWDVQYGAASGSFGFSASMSQSQGQKRRGASRSTYDRWLMTRFSIAFVILSIFELSNMLFQFTGMQNSNKDALRSSPDISVERAKETAVLFLPGPAPSFLIFIVFGTTAPFRKHMYRTFVSKCWQRQEVERKRTVPRQGSQHAAAPNTQNAMPTLPQERAVPLYRPMMIPQKREFPLRDLERGVPSSQRPRRMTNGRYYQYNDRGIRT
ncbi:glycoside hydrolase [Apiospora hydei]|uniref:Glycoside hydrolase n=1 Tax=Apiospora hydei TaxID=1337664 RepID=A0ABR1VIF5_9PEZI